MASVRSDVDQVGTRLLVRLSGELSLGTPPRVRTLLMKCLVDQPDALVVDLSGLTVLDKVALSVFLAVARQAAVWPGTPIVLSDTTDLIRSDRYGRLTVFRSVEDALAAEPRQNHREAGDSLLPVSGAAHRARELAAAACTRWELPHLVGPAQVVVNELVTNAVEHAQTMIDVRLSTNRRYLLIAVRDGAAATPRLDPQAGRGLMLVQAMAKRWGSIPADGGKVVWASLPLAA